MPTLTRTPDVIVVGGGHNGLVAATLLAGAGHRVLVLESAGHLGGAAVSARPFPGVDARISRYSYLVSLFPQALLRELGVDVELRRRGISSYTPAWRRGRPDLRATPARPRATLARTLGDDAGRATRWTRLGGADGRRGRACFPTLTEPLRSRDELRAWSPTTRPGRRCSSGRCRGCSSRSFDSDLVRGIVATDALIGTFAALDDPGLRQNRCFLYHVIGNGTGRWDVPVGGMGALIGRARGRRPAGGRRSCALSAPVTRIDSDGAGVAVHARRRRGVRGPARARQRRSGGAGRLLGDPPPGARARGRRS